MADDTLPPPIAYLYHDAATPDAAHPLWHSTLLVLAAQRRPHCTGETALHPEDTVRRLLAERDERIRVLTEVLDVLLGHMTIAVHKTPYVALITADPEALRRAMVNARAALEVSNG